MSKHEVDMHIHSSISDGLDDPGVIPWKAKRAGLKAICLTDHDCHLGLPDFLASAASCQIDAMAGIEVSSKYKGIDVHILGYGIDLTRDSFLRNRLEKCWESSRRRAQTALDLYVKSGYLPDEVTLEEIREKTCSKGPYLSLMHIRAYRAGLFGLSYQELSGEISRGGVAYVRDEDQVILSPEKAIDFIEEAGGFPVLAHPDEFMKRTDGTPQEAEKALNEVLDMFQERKKRGIEVYHSSHSPDKRRYYYELARRRGFAITAGSDYHGKFKPNVPLGMEGVTHEEFLDFKRLCEA